MKVERVSEDFWRVTEGHKSWTAKSVANFGLRYWVIDNSRGARVDPGGPTGRRVISAIRKSDQTKPPNSLGERATQDQILGYNPETGV